MDRPPLGHAGHDTDDGGRPPRLGPVLPEDLSDRVPVGIVPLDEGLVDHDRAGLLAALARPEDPPGEDRDAHRLEVARADVGVLHQGALGFGVVRLVPDQDLAVCPPFQRQLGGDRGPLHPRHAAEAIDQPFPEGGLRLVGFVPFPLEGDPRRGHVLGVEGEGDVEHVPVARVEQHGPVRQQEGEGDLTHREHAEHAVPSPGGGHRARSPAQRRDDVGPRRGQCRRQPEKEPGEHRQGEGEEQHAGVDLDALRSRHLGRDDAPDEVDAPHRQEHAGGAAQQGDQAVLGEQLGQDPPPAGTEALPDRHLGLAVDTAREEHAGHVGAGGEQHEADGGEQDQELRAQPPDDLGLEGQDPDLGAGVGLRVLLLEPGGDPPYLGLGRSPAHSRLQSGHGQKAEAAPPPASGCRRGVHSSTLCPLVQGV